MKVVKPEVSFMISRVHEAVHEVRGRLPLSMMPAAAVLAQAIAALELYEEARLESARRHPEAKGMMPVERIINGCQNES